ncbi:hypothetical protein SEA_HAMISH_87 [Mycobacterium phage Hamish]|uniref:Uncharacterized protein n=8 Tax=Pegunavirus TaxID=1623295 RepID=X4Y726_9CAUD|nr:hypothetical protein PBI_SWISH_91 [Mycobacterium phage Swish]YP_009191082.1 hypothetical protein AU159_gp088 [Mycobacterium phage Colbert]ADA83916.1 hypothetical protein FANG_91 [Mycobacterium phage Fang]AIM50322.1 hypothetical protein PBI_VIVALDI_90 [Mycobacterium phage Vivaldi]ATN91024.1 hypothetical protein SEA_MIKOTA_85 [Mycobacterium phage Mikota]AUV60490.1 hypothetical protein SEA_HAIMAS_87 [Mycobacterium phage Haimas]AVJ50204.1 hypothetical protein SEA_MEGATRON_91 [Mycobacterium pha
MSATNLVPDLVAVMSTGRHARALLIAKQPTPNYAGRHRAPEVEPPVRVGSVWAKAIGGGPW